MTDLGNRWRVSPKSFSVGKIKLGGKSYTYRPIREMSRLVPSDFFLEIKQADRSAELSRMSARPGLLASSYPLNHGNIFKGKRVSIEG
jgi:hypothetical protein